ncbi:MAG: winged helix-turn-helix domain-containing protein, partial [Dehalococcoidia bacterium]|nr:winged helix-turn-helix domain-containing protein [Dehalococcoidia bacterium]
MKQIFEILQNNARATPEQIATMTGIPVSKVNEVIN